MHATQTVQPDTASTAEALPATEVARVAKLAALPVHPSHAAELAAVVAFVRQVQAVPTANVPPARSPSPVTTTVTMDDADQGAGGLEAADGEHLSTDTLLANAKHRQGPFFVVRSPRATAGS